MNYTKNNIRTTQIQTNVEECGPCPVFPSYTLAFALQLRKNHGKTSIRVSSNLSQIKNNLQSQYSIHIAKITLPLQSPHQHTHYKTHSYTHYKTVYNHHSNN
jgi:hypothetical protein